MHGAQKEHCVAERATEELEQRKQRQHAVDLPLRALPPGCTQKLRLSKAFQWLSRTVELLAATALERAASTTSQQGATASEDVASELERISTMSRGILAEADLAAEARGLLQSAESLTELRGRMRDLEDLDRASWDGAKRSKEDGEKMLESRLGDLERVLSELAYREILAKVSPARLGERWSPLEKKIEFCAVEELRQSAPRSSVQERVCTAFQLAAVLPDAAERIGRELDRAPGLPAFVSDRTEIRKRMITELDCCRNMEELLGRMRGHLGV
ncbi:unnamed protein product [Prorocentrum cordatum]|uniref:Uncharacterized protein n=1 Tax=Prorocentrum cordatum TaxID=2364126 RepID=A0ABN9V5U6_9DINO|nr:unnamed protein product [Polarella glacialis]